jgi:hypothetical protein
LPHWAPSSAPPLKKINGLLPQSQGPRTCSLVNEFNIEKQLTLCLACNLLQISPLKLCFEKLSLNVFQNAGNAISETQILKMTGFVAVFEILESLLI